MSGLMDKAKNAMSGGGSDGGSSGGDKSSGGLGGMEAQGKEAAVDQKLNSELTQKGVPKGADKEIDGVVNSEMKKF